MNKQKYYAPYMQAVMLGIIAGMRSASAMTVVSHILSERPSKTLKGTALNFMETDRMAGTMKVAAIGEFIGDKLPIAKDRIIPGSVIARSVSGALASASIFKSANKSAITGALLGGGVAIASTFVSFYLRKAIVKYTKIADPLVGLAEDALVVGTGICIARQ